MKTYIYKSIILNKLIDNSRLNVLGRQGWELCGFSQDQNDYIYYFKKPNFYSEVSSIYLFFSLSASSLNGIKNLENSLASTRFSIPSRTII